jgi:hypothetical protein
MLALVLMFAALIMSGCGKDTGTSSANGGSGPGPDTGIMSKSWSLSWEMELHGDIAIDDHDVAVDAGGNVTAVWKENEGGANSIVASTYDAEAGLWSPSVKIGDSSNSGLAFGPKVSMGPGGEAVVVWCQFDGSRFSIYANLYDYTTGTWGTPAEIDYEAGGHAFLPQVDMDDEGNAVAIWYQHDGNRYAIFSSRLDVVQGIWGNAESVENMPAGGSFHPSIDGAPNGTVMAVWKQTDGLKDSVWANMYDPEARSWETPTLIENYNEDHAQYPVVAMNGDGDAVVSWYMYDGSRYSIYANVYDGASGSWGNAGLVEDMDNGDSFSPKVAIDGNGDIIAVWTFDDGASSGIYANRYDAAAGTWTGVVTLDPGDADYVEMPHVAMDADGNAVVVWQQGGTSYHIRTSRYDVLTRTWGAIESICEKIASERQAPGHNPNIGQYEPHVHSSQSGRAVVIWRRSAPNYSGIKITMLL